MRFIKDGRLTASLGLLPVFVSAQVAPDGRTPISSSEASSVAVPAESPAVPQAVPPYVPPNASEGADGFLSRLRAEDILKYDWGKLQVKPHFATLALFTDNFQYRESKYAESEEIVSINPGFQIQYGSEDYNHVVFDYTHDEILYLSHSNFDTQQNHLKLSDKIAYNRWTLTGSDQIDFLSSFIGIGNTKRTVLINRRPWIDDYTLVLDASTRLRPFFEAFHSGIEYDPNSGFYSDQLLRGKLGTSYVLTSRVNLSTDAYYGQEVPSATSPLQPPTFYNTIVGAGFGANGEFTTRLRGSVHFGYELRSVPHNPLLHDRGSPTVELDLTYTPTYYSQVGLTVSRNTTVSANTPTTAVANRINLSATQYLSADLKWALQLTVGGSLTDYTDTLLGNVPVPFPVHTPSGDGIVTLYSPVHTGRSDQNYNIGLNLNYTPNRWLRTTIGIALDDYAVSYSDRLYTLFNAATTTGLKPYQAKSVFVQVSIGF